MLARMDELIDVLIVGGGPGGLFMAARLAARGVRTLVCEEHARIGDPVHCTGVLSADSFTKFDLPDSATLNQLTSVRFLSPGGIPVDYTTPAPLATVIDRPVFDRALADRAVAAGAEIRVGARVTTLDVDQAGVRAVAGEAVVHARLAVLACGAAYKFQRRFGFGLPTTYLQTAQRELPASCPRDVELHFGQDVAPGGFAWAVPVLRPQGA
jgi:digeranylgeranylglycerophospholipid reductase